MAAGATALLHRRRLGDLAWETAHLPLYTIWREGTPSRIVFGAAHCTGGDYLIAVSALVLAQLAGGIAGSLFAHGMFDLPLLQASATARTGLGQWLTLASARGLRNIKDVMLRKTILRDPAVKY